MTQIQGTITLEGIQKGKKQIHHNDKIPKGDHIHNWINATTRNSKKLYQLITKLAGQNESNPLPTFTSNEELAD